MVWPKYFTSSPYSDFGPGWDAEPQARIERIAKGAAPGCPLAYRYTQGMKQKKLSYVRRPFYEVLQKFGGYMALTVRWCALILAASQGHSLDNAIINKIYSTGHSKKDDSDSNSDSDSDEKDKTGGLLESDREKEA